MVSSIINDWIERKQEARKKKENKRKEREWKNIYLFLSAIEPNEWKWDAKENYVAAIVLMVLKKTKKNKKKTKQTIF